MYAYIRVCICVHIYAKISKQLTAALAPPQQASPHHVCPQGLLPGSPRWEGDSTCHNGLEAPFALGGVLPSSALVAQDLVVLGHKCLVGQGVKALGTAEASVMPVAVFVVHLVGIRSNGIAAFHRGVGRTFQSTSGSSGGHPSAHTSSSARGPCSSGSRTSQPWCPPCIWRDLTLGV